MFSWSRIFVKYEFDNFIHFKTISFLDKDLYMIVSFRHDQKIITGLIKDRWIGPMK